MAKDYRYTAVKNLIMTGHIKTFKDIFNLLPYTTVAKDLGINNVRFAMLMDTLEGFSLRQLFKLADLMEIDSIHIFNLIYHQRAEQLKAKKRKG
jgi:hypothetical protein